jgi:hypothetical protein
LIEQQLHVHAILKRLLVAFLDGGPIGHGI